MAQDFPDDPRDGNADPGEPRRNAAHASGKDGKSRGFGAWLREVLTIVVIALLLSFLIKTFLFRAFFIPSGSMEQTLEIHDRIFVNLLVPEPFDLTRGDVVVFKDTQGWLPPTGNGDDGNFIADALTFVGLLPDESEQHLVKRIIGMPGDHVTCCTADGKITINGEPIDEPYVYAGALPSEAPFDVVVPEGKVWVMGDHRNASADSREHQDGANEGFVNIEDIEGKAAVIAWPLDRAGFIGSYPEVFKNVPAPAGAETVSP
ncbi:signal peptidase I [Arthrobacter sp. zg-Y916]|uniref:signal peptidase I n=1 Tax=Arthrobacter sp. zg-Y916 TaxID=2894190 RepID=UPI001E2F7ACE|nr:signal peptidase I [Arthrobacter sp. zg-Y916]MCC9193808.1 signal peptidase I [Arthrobacter sp. zg-Y916]